MDTPTTFPAEFVSRKTGQKPAVLTISRLSDEEGIVRIRVQVAPS